MTEPTEVKLRWWAGFGWVAALAGLVLAVQALVSRYLFWDSYMGLVAGRYVATQGIPTVEVLTTAARPLWIDQQWLAHLLFYVAWEVGGLAATALLSALSVTLGFTLLAALMVQRGVAGPRALALAFAALGVALGGTVVRAQSLSLPLAVLVLWMILEDSTKPAYRARFGLVVLVLILWANLHGSVVLGAGLVGTYAAVRAVGLARAGDRRSATLYALSAALALITVVVTPYGLGVLDYYQALLGSTTVHLFIVEWTRPTVGNPYSLGFFAMLAATVGVVAYGLVKGVRPPALLLLGALGLALLALTGVRFQVWFGIVAAVLVAEVLTPARTDAAALPRPVVAAGGLAVATAAILGFAALASTSDDQFQQTLPLGAMQTAATYVVEHPDATVLADQTGSALLWLYPNVAGHVAYDARLEQYSDESLLAWFEYLNGLSPGWPALASGYDLLLASASENQRLIELIDASTNWSTLYADRNGALFTRTVRQ